MVLLLLSLPVLAGTITISKFKHIIFDTRPCKILDPRLPCDGFPTFSIFGGRGLSGHYYNVHFTVQTPQKDAAKFA